MRLLLFSKVEISPFSLELLLLGSPNSLRDIPTPQGISLFLKGSPSSLWDLPLSHGISQLL